MKFTEGEEPLELLKQLNTNEFLIFNAIVSLVFFVL